MKPPRLFEKQPFVRGDRPRTTQDMVKRRHVGALGVTSLHRLVEPLRIADQHHGLRHLRHREHVGERHLRGLVDEQHIDRLERVWP